MVKRVQRVGHTPVAAAAFTGLEREITVEKTTWALRLHDGVTVGGHVFDNAAASDVKDAQVLTDAGVAADTGDALSMLKAVITSNNEVVIGTASDTEGVLAIAASRILARLAAGNIVAATPTQLVTLLALTIGTDTQAFDASLLSLALLATGADKLPYATGVDTYAETDFTAFGRTLIANANAADARTDLDVPSNAEALLTGEIRIYAVAAAPTGWLLCDGATVSQSTFAALFAAIGADAFGTDGGGNFDLPDLRGRSPIGIGTGAGLTARTMGDELGEEDHQNTEAETAAHTHDAGPNAQAISHVGGGGGQWNIASAGVGTSTSTGGDTAHNTMQPSLALNFIIKT